MKKKITYKSGADMWREYADTYGEAEARGICSRYLDMQVFNKDPEEIQFCRELFEAMPKPSIQKPSLLSDLIEKNKSVQGNLKERTALKKREER